MMLVDIYCVIECADGYYNLHPRILI